MSSVGPENEGAVDTYDTYWQRLLTGFVLQRQDSELQILCTTSDGSTRLLPGRRTSLQGAFFCLRVLMHRRCTIGRHITLIVWHAWRCRT